VAECRHHVAQRARLDCGVSAGREQALARSTLPDIVLSRHRMARVVRSTSTGAALQSAPKSAQRHAHDLPVFDLLWLAGKDLRGETIEARRALLDTLIAKDTARDGLRDQRGRGRPKAVLQSRASGLRGIAWRRSAARGTCPESRGRWLKLKCHRRQEFAVVGYVPMVGGKVVGALLLAV